MRTIILGTFLCVLMSWPIASHAQSATNSEPVYSAKNFGETNQAKEVERQMRNRNYSNQKLEKAVKDAVRESSNSSTSGSSNSSSSNSSSGSGNSSNSNKGSSTSSNSGSNQSQTKNSNSDNTTSKCTSCTKKADALKNSRNKWQLYYC